MTAFLFLASLLLVLYLSSPWLVSSEHPDDGADTVLKDLLRQKDKLLTAYRDLELDFDTQKMSSEDFTGQKAALLGELEGVYKSIDAARTPSKDA